MILRHVQDQAPGLMYCGLASSRTSHAYLIGSEMFCNSSQREIGGTFGSKLAPEITDGDWALVPNFFAKPPERQLRHQREWGEPNLGICLLTEDLFTSPVMVITSLWTDC